MSIFRRNDEIYFYYDEIPDGEVCFLYYNETPDDEVCLSKKEMKEELIKYPNLKRVWKKL